MNRSDKAHTDFTSYHRTIASFPIVTFSDLFQFWIRDKAKARIKCVKPSCPIRIHENDINAVLDEQEDALNLFMPLDHRQYLQYYHNKDVIYYAFGGNEYVKQCPLCKSMYIEKEGCSYVTCANLRCRTRFCWQCGEPIESIMHFTGQTCRVGYDDIERGLFWVKLAVDVRAFALILYVPVFFLACMVGIPLYVLLAFPSFLAQRVYNNATVKTDYLTTAEKILVAFKMVSIFLAGIPVGLFLALNSIVTGGTIFAIYVAFTVFKASPYAKVS
ncbi:hypothetical protein OSTOST_09085 [Ostertagia ostertagi]